MALYINMRWDIFHLTENYVKKRTLNIVIREPNMILEDAVKVSYGAKDQIRSESGAQIEIED